MLVASLVFIKTQTKGDGGAMQRKQICFLKFPHCDSVTITEHLLGTDTGPITFDMCDIIYFQYYTTFADEERDLNRCVTR